MPRGQGYSAIWRVENAQNDPVSLDELSELVTQSTRAFLCARIGIHSVSSVSPLLAGAIPPGSDAQAPKQKQGFFSATTSLKNALAKRAQAN